MVAGDIIREACPNVDLLTDAAEAVLRVGARAYDLILMDLFMPGMDGIEATRRIRALPQGGAIPIIAMTASVDSADQDACLAAGLVIRSFMPAEPADVLAMLHKWLTRAVPSRRV